MIKILSHKHYPIKHITKICATWNFPFLRNEHCHSNSNRTKATYEELNRERERERERRRKIQRKVEDNEVERGERNIRGKNNTKREGGLLTEFNDPSKSVGESASKLLTRIKYWRVSCRSTRPPRSSALVNPIEYSITSGDTYTRSWPTLMKLDGRVQIYDRALSDAFPQLCTYYGNTLCQRWIRQGLAIEVEGGGGYSAIVFRWE